jgi:type IV pilus assembly protein PilQ
MKEPLIALLGMTTALCLQVPASARPARVQETVDSTRITLELQDTDVRDALRMVAKQGGLDLVMSNKVKGTLSLDLGGASLREALEAIVSIAGFQYELAGDILTVGTREELEERARRFTGSVPEVQAPSDGQQVLVLQLRYVDAERLMPVVEKLLGEGGKASVLKSPDALTQEHRPAENRTADARSLQIGSRLSTSTQGQAARSHTLIVVDAPERLDRIQEVVRTLDRKPVQVLIEARFVEVALDNDHKLGIDWNVVASASGASAPHTFPFGESSLGSFDPMVAGGSPGGIFPNAPNSVTTPASPGLFTFGTLDFSAFSAVLRMIQKDARVQIVSNPRLVVGDRQTATILVGERFPVLSATISEFGTVTETLDHYEPIGVQLEVTPSVLEDDEIELFVRPSTSSLGPAVEGSSGLTVARINTRQIDTSVTAKDSQTVVLGGLITERESVATNRVPFLGSVPLLGKLFTHESTQLERVDLVVFLTVTILRDGLGELSDADREMLSRSYSDASGAPPGTRSALEYSPATPQY